MENEAITNRGTDQGPAPNIGQILHHLTDAVIAVNDSGLIQYVNPATEELLGRSQHELMGSAFGIPTPDGDGEVHLIAKDGAVRSAIVNAMPQIKWGDAGYVSVLVIRDVTEQKKTAIALAKANETLAERIAAFEHFSYGLAHDLRSPLRAAQIFLAILRDENQTLAPEERLTYIERSLSRCAFMNKLIEGMLGFANSTVRPLKIEMLNTTAVVNGIVNALEETYPGASSFISVHSLPHIKGDSLLIGQVFSNLLSNALKYSIDGQDPKIEVADMSTEHEVHISIKDNGIGFEPKDSQRIFEAFIRLEPGHSDGVGVGLANVKKIIERHGGLIWAEGQPKNGAVFHLCFPRHPATEIPERLPK